MDFTDIFPFAPEVGYVGLTIINFLGSLIPFVPIPGFLLLATMSVGDEYNIHILAILASLAAAGAKQIIFTVSYGGRRILNESTRKRMKPFERLVKKYGGAAAFFAAATPMPDDLIYIPLGLAKYNPKRFFLATLSGKLVLHYVIVLSSHFVGLSLIEPYLADVDDASIIYIGIIAFAAILTAIIILMLRLDWAKILGKMAPWTLEDENDKK